MQRSGTLHRGGVEVPEQAEEENKPEKAAALGDESSDGVPSGAPVDFYPEPKRKFSKKELTYRLAYAEAKDWSLAHGRQISPLPLPEAIEQRIKQWFLLVDDDGSGALDAAELEVALKASGIPANANAILEVIKLFDFDKDGEIAWREFHHFLCYEVMADKDPLGAEYVLPSGMSLPISSMIGAIRRRKLMQDVEKGGTRRDHWVTEGPEFLRHLLESETYSFDQQEASGEVLRRILSYKPPPSKRADPEAMERHSRRMDKLKSILTRSMKDGGAGLGGAGGGGGTAEAAEVGGLRRGGSRISRSGSRSATADGGLRSRKGTAAGEGEGEAGSEAGTGSGGAGSSSTAAARLRTKSAVRFEAAAAAAVRADEEERQRQRRRQQQRSGEGAGAGGLETHAEASREGVHSTDADTEGGGHSDGYSEFDDREEEEEGEEAESGGGTFLTGLTGDYAVVRGRPGKGRRRRSLSDDELDAAEAAAAAAGAGAGVGGEEGAAGAGGGAGVADADVTREVVGQMARLEEVLELHRQRSHSITSARPRPASSVVALSSLRANSPRTPVVVSLQAAAAAPGPAGATTSSGAATGNSQSGAGGGSSSASQLQLPGCSSSRLMHASASSRAHGASGSAAHHLGHSGGASDVMPPGLDSLEEMNATGEQRARGHTDMGVSGSSGSGMAGESGLDLDLPDDDEAWDADLAPPRSAPAQGFMATSPGEVGVGGGSSSGAAESARSERVKRPAVTAVGVAAVPRLALNSLRSVSTPHAHGPYSARLARSARQQWPAGSGGAAGVASASAAAHNHLHHLASHSPHGSVSARALLPTGAGASAGAAASASAAAAGEASMAAGSGVTGTGSSGALHGWTAAEANGSGSSSNTAAPPAAEAALHGASSFHRGQSSRLFGGTATTELHRPQQSPTPTPTRIVCGRAEAAAAAADIRRAAWSPARSGPRTGAVASLPAGVGTGASVSGGAIAIGGVSGWLGTMLGGAGGSGAAGGGSPSTSLPTTATGYTTTSIAAGGAAGVPSAEPSDLAPFADAGMGVGEADGPETAAWAAAVASAAAQAQVYAAATAAAAAVAAEAAAARPAGLAQRPATHQGIRTLPPSHPGYGHGGTGGNGLPRHSEAANFLGHGHGHGHGHQSTFPCSPLSSPRPGSIGVAPSVAGSVHSVATSAGGGFGSVLRVSEPTHTHTHTHTHGHGHAHGSQQQQGRERKAAAAAAVAAGAGGTAAGGGRRPNGPASGPLQHLDRGVEVVPLEWLASPRGHGGGGGGGGGRAASPRAPPSAPATWTGLAPSSPRHQRGFNTLSYSGTLPLTPRRGPAGFGPPPAAAAAGGQPHAASASFTAGAGSAAQVRRSIDIGSHLHQHQRGFATASGDAGGGPWRGSAAGTTAAGPNTSGGAAGGGGHGMLAMPPPSPRDANNNSSSGGGTNGAAASSPMRGRVMKTSLAAALRATPPGGGGGVGSSGAGSPSAAAGGPGGMRQASVSTPAVPYTAAGPPAAWGWAPAVSEDGSGGGISGGGGRATGVLFGGSVVPKPAGGPGGSSGSEAPAHAGAATGAAPHQLPHNRPPPQRGDAPTGSGAATAAAAHADGAGAAGNWMWPWDGGDLSVGRAAAPTQAGHAHAPQQARVGSAVSHLRASSLRPTEGVKQTSTRTMY
ncbi:hypothetical protein CHLRE_12g545500v5 [Chlamydomonas reinhardtii]|uniref:EF-hand domain-containing protein n=1 Tax=Chlamydomonas reinhardtii TaxID=3055 RepID=A0A2K3D6K7_CHLRE|nr:uncharacterized protein CHLRE_12g545500v5 [Chlamydomonas reinhardtii]PNW76161.1 hypothetical protein CHLRE_12g545500v5 [Chlamydomonas reinhardtii]